MDILEFGGVFADGAFGIDGVKDFADDMEGRDEVHSPITDIDADFVADFGLESWGGFDFAIKGYIVWIAIEKCFGIKGDEAFFTKLAYSIEFALDDIEFFVDFCEGVLGFDEDHSVLAMGVVGADIGHGAMVDVESRVEGFPLEGFCSSWCNMSKGCTAAWAGGGM